MMRIIGMMFTMAILSAPLRLVAQATNIMQAFSTYETHRDSADARPIRGINSIQLFNDGSRWWVVGVMWDNERPDKPIPAAYLKR
jgi:hypothetical protein